MKTLYLLLIVLVAGCSQWNIKQSVTKSEQKIYEHIVDTVSAEPDFGLMLTDYTMDGDYFREEGKQEGGYYYTIITQKRHDTTIYGYEIVTTCDKYNYRILAWCHEDSLASGKCDEYNRAKIWIEKEKQRIKAEKLARKQAHKVRRKLNREFRKIKCK